VNGQLEQWLHDAEESLLQPEIRRSAYRVATLIAEEFVEFGSSGKIYAKQQVIAVLRRMEHVPMGMQDFHAVEIASDTVLVTYRAARTDGDGSSLRSSLWKQIKALSYNMRKHSHEKCPSIPCSSCLHHYCHRLPPAG
jgi:hypothetical protein